MVSSMLTRLGPVSKLFLTLNSLYVWTVVIGAVGKYRSVGGEDTNAALDNTS